MSGISEKKDIVEKEFVAFPDITADVLNTLLYQGEAVVDADGLRSGPTESVYQGDKRLRSQYEDLCKYKYADGVENWLEEQGIREEDEVSVCELFDQYERKGRVEGERKGRIEGERKGMEKGVKCGEARRLVKDVESAMQFFKVTLEKACEGLGTTVHGYEEARKICLESKADSL